MDFSKLSQNNWIAAGGGALAFVSGFFPWFSFDTGTDLFGISTSIGGFNSGFLAWAGILLVVGGAAVLMMKVLDVSDLKLQGLSAEQLAMVLCGLGTLLIILRLLFVPGGSLDGFGWGRAWGIFVGTIAAIAATAGAFLSAQDKGIGIPSADDFTGGGGGGGAAGGSPSEF